MVVASRVSLVTIFSLGVLAFAAVPSADATGAAGCCVCTCLSQVSCSDDVAGRSCELSCPSPATDGITSQIQDCSMHFPGTACSAVSACADAASSTMAPASSPLGLVGVAIGLVGAGLYRLRRRERA